MLLLAILLSNLLGLSCIEAILIFVKCQIHICNDLTVVDCDGRVLAMESEEKNYCAACTSRCFNGKDILDYGVLMGLVIVEY